MKNYCCKIMLLSLIFFSCQIDDDIEIEEALLNEVEIVDLISSKDFSIENIFDQEKDLNDSLIIGVRRPRIGGNTIPIPETETEEEEEIEIETEEETEGEGGN